MEVIWTPQCVDSQMPPLLQRCSLDLVVVFGRDSTIGTSIVARSIGERCKSFGYNRHIDSFGQS